LMTRADEMAHEITTDEACCPRDGHVHGKLRKIDDSEDESSGHLREASMISRVILVA
jgi:hypothetical protein